MGLDEQQHVFLAELDCQPVFQGSKAKRTSMLVIGICLALLSGVSLAFVIRKKREKKPGREDMVSTPVETVPSNEKSELADKLKAIMEEKQLFRNKDFRAFKAVCGVTPSEWKQELPLHP